MYISICIDRGSPAKFRRVALARKLLSASKGHIADLIAKESREIVRFEMVVVVLVCFWGSVIAHSLLPTLCVEGRAEWSTHYGVGVRRSSNRRLCALDTLDSLDSSLTLKLVISCFIICGTMLRDFLTGRRVRLGF